MNGRAVNHWLGLGCIGLALAAGTAACAVEDDDPPRGDESGTTASQSAEEQQAECDEAIAALACSGALSAFFLQGDQVEGVIVVALDDAPRIELTHGYLLEAGENVLLGDALAHNDQCLVGCLLSDVPGGDYCVAIDAEGSEACTFTGPSDAESCESLAAECVGG
jgi:hypothetical protein